MRKCEFFLISSTIAGVFLLVTGCSTLAPPNSSNTTNKVSRPKVQNTTVKATSTPTNTDGQVISLTPITVSDTPNLKTYKMVYWSENTPTEAFVSVPKKSGSYPLLVNCHGGFDIATPETHEPSPANANILQGASSNYIELIPEYRGYEDSDGTVPDLNGEVIDTNNAIKAIQSRYDVEAYHIDLLGTSVGGAVVLKLASERPDIHSVLAVSPFIGWDSMGEWAKSNLQNPVASRWYKRYDYSLRSF
ncbi:hypothetical protein AAC03nite_38940 [Alicyclobacillus acidoterrestris]|nr:hypothetical protein AAC03nite_38940 [Alicyclobacillus acidoterrestris]